MEFFEFLFRVILKHRKRVVLKRAIRKKSLVEIVLALACQ